MGSCDAAKRIRRIRLQGLSAATEPEMDGPGQQPIVARFPLRMPVEELCRRGYLATHGSGSILRRSKFRKFSQKPGFLLATSQTLVL